MAYGSIVADDGVWLAWGIDPELGLNSCKKGAVLSASEIGALGAVLSVSEIGDPKRRCIERKRNRRLKRSRIERKRNRLLDAVCASSAGGGALASRA